MSYHFISGLPRSGSTLLAAVLRQNPAITANLQSPLGYSVIQLQESMSGVNEAHLYYTDLQRARIIEAVFDAYYENDLDKTIFDTNRRWCANVALLAKIFPSCKIICCVRPPAHIVDSIERLLRNNPLHLSALIGCKPNLTVYERVKMIMQPSGLVGYAYDALREAFFGPERERLLFVSYAELAKDPERCLRWLHTELGLQPFDYDFNAIKQLSGAEEFDKALGTPGLHTVKSRIVYEPRNSILPPDIYKSLPPAFWLGNKAATNSG